MTCVGPGLQDDLTIAEMVAVGRDESRRLNREVPVDDVTVPEIRGLTRLGDMTSELLRGISNCHGDYVVRIAAENIIARRAVEARESGE